MTRSLTTHCILLSRLFALRFRLAGSHIRYGDRQCFATLSGAHSLVLSRKTHVCLLQTKLRLTLIAESTLEVKLWQSPFPPYEEAEMDDREWLRIQELEFYSDGIFNLVPRRCK
jgi:hypothetical protein